MHEPDCASCGRLILSLAMCHPIKLSGTTSGLAAISFEYRSKLASSHQPGKISPIIPDASWWLAQYVIIPSITTYRLVRYVANTRMTGNGFFPCQVRVSHIQLHQFP